jgi:hypothetical protein
LQKKNAVSHIAVQFEFALIYIIVILFFLIFVIRRLRKQNIRARRPYRGLVLTARHRQQREQWASQHQRMMHTCRVGEMSSSRMKAALICSIVTVGFEFTDSKDSVERRLQRDRYGGGSVMVLAGVTLHKRIDLIIIRVNLTAVKYQQDFLFLFLIFKLVAGV